MIDFKKISLQDKLWIDKLIKSSNYEGSNFNFSNMFLWDDSFSQSVACVNGFLIIKHKNFYAIPLGNGNLKNVILDLIEDSKQRNCKFALRGLTADIVVEVKEIFNDDFEFIPNRDRFDYVYNIEKLCKLSGKKLQGKRNHINKFIATYNWSFENLNSENIDECKEMSDKWFSLSGNDSSEHSLSNEKLAIDKAFSNYFHLGLEGGFIRANGQIVAFTMGEKLTDDMFVIHFEKAFKDIDGAYPMINREFCRYIFNKYSSIRHINREEDMGIDGLRKAKMSYRPDFFVEKYTAIYLR